MPRFPIYSSRLLSARACYHSRTPCTYALNAFTYAFHVPALRLIAGRLDPTALGA